MIWARDQPGLAFEADQAGRMGCECFGQDLDGDIASQPRVRRTIDSSNAVGAQGAHDLAGAKAGSGSKRRRWKLPER